MTDTYEKSPPAPRLLRLGGLLIPGPFFQGALSGYTDRAMRTIAREQGAPLTYAGLMLDQVTGATWVADLVVDRPLRRKGIGSTLLLAAADWASTQNSHDMVLEMQPKNGPAVSMALKLGFEFCGYNDFYYPVNEIGFFFRKSF